MALIKCPECGREISDLASSCPGCGLPSKHFKAVIKPSNNSPSGKWEPILNLEDALLKFPTQNEMVKLNTDYRLALEKVFWFFQNNGLHTYTYKNGFLGFSNDIVDGANRIYIAITNSGMDAAFIIRVPQGLDPYTKFICKTAFDVEKYMPMAVAILQKHKELEMRSNQSAKAVVQEPTEHIKNPEKIEVNEPDILKDTLPDRYISESESCLLAACMGGIDNAKSIINRHNDNWINQQLIIKKDYLDNILSRIDPSISLDEDQRRAILTDEDHALIVAGAGAGKTTTMAAKVKYLIDCKRVRPERILVISYTNKAVDELRDRINKKLQINAIISTFHKFGYEIIKKAKPETPNIHVYPASIISDYLETIIMQNQPMLRRILYFFSLYFDIPEEAIKFDSLEKYHLFKAAQDLQTLKSNLNEYNKQVMDIRTKAMRTCRGEYLRSYQEVQIANFLYLFNLEYEYEKHYENPLPELTKPYTPDFYIKQGELTAYLEHFGISENGTHSFYSPKQLARYVSRIQDKRNIHGRYGTTLLETYSSYIDDRPMLDHLADQLTHQGFTLKERSTEEVYQKIIDTSKDKYFYRFVDFMTVFISRFKTNGFEIDKFDEFRKNTDNVRTLLFLDIVEDVYHAYENELKNRDCIDFDDMINEAEKILNWLKSQGRKLPFDYVIIDEYQDISLQRFNLAKRLTEVTDAKIVAVGDDWQSIFAFAGSDITLFTRFLELMGSGIELKITHTYRNSQELIDAAGSFIQKNDSQIKKKLISPKKLNAPIQIIVYDDSEKVLENRAKALVKSIGQIIKEFGNRTSILLIGRYNFDMYQYAKTKYFELISDTNLKCLDYPEARLTFLTAHNAKGLGFDNVILINAIDHRYGFPCQVEDDPVLKFVIHQDKSIPFAEERRLFYVAMTRTKNRLIVLVPKNRPSRFVVELIKEHSVVCDELNAVTIDDSWKLGLRCPICGYPLKYEPFKTSIGLPLYICTNEPEICDFMTNSREQLSDICRCEKCENGYLIVKKRRKDRHFFYGCTNFKDDGTGCSNAREISMVDISFDIAPKS
jgi:DNA helicase IV